MITQFQVHSYFIEQLPKLLRRRVSAKPVNEQPMTAKAAILAFSEYTKSMVVQCDLARTQQCLRVAEQLYLNGDVTVRMLIESIYVCVFASFLPAAEKDRMRWENLIPQGLKRTYDSYAFPR